MVLILERYTFFDSHSCNRFPRFPGHRCRGGGGIAGPLGSLTVIAWQMMGGLKSEASGCVAPMVEGASAAPPPLPLPPQHAQQWTSSPGISVILAPQTCRSSTGCTGCTPRAGRRSARGLRPAGALCGPCALSVASKTWRLASRLHGAGAAVSRKCRPERRRLPLPPLILTT